jgi:ADP-ribosylglycohydrolase
MTEHEKNYYEMMRSRIIGGIIGLVAGDAMGVPYEFLSKESIQNIGGVEPMMVGWGTHNQVPGTWSDDSSMTLATMESIILTGKIDGKDLMDRFLSWLRSASWTPHGRVFDSGVTTSMAIHKYARGFAPENCGAREENSQGNGSLMRILPVALWMATKRDTYNSMEIVKYASNLTHAQPLVSACCCYYSTLVRTLLRGFDFEYAKSEADLWIEYFADKRSLALMTNIIHGDVMRKMPDKDYCGSGYVIRSLEASIHAVATTDNYEDAIVKSIELADDTDTTAAIAGGLAGMIYTTKGIPFFWVEELARLDTVMEVTKIFAEKVIDEFKIEVEK